MMLKVKILQFCGSNNFKRTCSKKFSMQFLWPVGYILASFCKFFIKFCWHGKKLFLVLPDASAASPLPLPSSWQETRVHESKKANKNIRNCQPMLLCKKEWAWLLKVMGEMGTRVIFSLLPITILGAIHKYCHLSFRGGGIKYSLMNNWGYIQAKFIYSEKATKFCEISTIDLSYVVPVKSTVKILQFCGLPKSYSQFSNLPAGKTHT